MGVEVCDPDHVEGDIERLPGLGLLPVSTCLTKEKTTRQVTFRIGQSEQECHGYEIHMGQTTLLPDAKAELLTLAADGMRSGCFTGQRCMGTYIHGILDNTSVIDFLLQPHVQKSAEQSTFDYATFKNEQYDKLAAHVRKHVNMDLIYKIMNRKKDE